MFVRIVCVVRKGGIRVAAKNPVVVCFTVLLKQSFYDRQAGPDNGTDEPRNSSFHLPESLTAKFPILHKSMFIVHISLMSEAEKWNNLI